MPLPGGLASLNKRAVAAAKAGNHNEALHLLDELFTLAAKQHLTHPELYIAYSNRAASHLALQQHPEALQDAQQCVLLLRAAAAHGGLLSCKRHPYWSKACQRLGAALLGLKQHQQAVTVFEAGLSADPLNPVLKLGLQQAQQGLISDLLSGKVNNHLALPAPPTPERITLAPHNPSRSAVQPWGCTGTASDAVSHLGPGRKYAVGWDLPAEQLIRYAEAGELSVVQGDGEGKRRAGSTLPRVLLSPTSALADTGMKDVYEYLKTQCDLQLPKRYLHRQLSDTPRLVLWWSATVAAVQAVVKSGRNCRVLLLGAKAGVLAIAAVRAGATHVTCVETCPHLAAACQVVLRDNGLPPSSFHVTSTHPTALKLGTDLPTVCNLLVADLVDDGVLSGGFIPAVAHVLDELMVRENPVIIPAAVTVKAQAVGLRPSGCLAVMESDGRESSSRKWLDLTALDQYRWTPSQALPSALDPAAFQQLSAPLTVWHMPSSAVVADMSGVKLLDVEFETDGSWCGVAFWTDMQLYEDISYTTAGPWRVNTPRCTRDLHPSIKSTQSACNGANLSSGSHCCSSVSPAQIPPSHQPAICWLEGEVPVKAEDVYPLIATHNTISFLFTLQEADYSRLLIKEPSFPHGQFAMAADQQRASAYYRAISAATKRAAAVRQQQQATETAAAATENGISTPVGITLVDVGCGSGVLSLLAAAAVEEELMGPYSSAAADPVDTAEPSPAGKAALEAAVVAADYVAPVAAAALRNVAANGYSKTVSVVHGDAAMLQRGVHVALTGADVVMFDVFESGLIGHQLLPLIETVKAKLLAEGGQVIPASATLYMMGAEINTFPEQTDAEADNSSSDVASQIHTSLNLSALEQFRWSGETETVLLDHLPHKQLTRPVKLFDFDFCQPVGAPYPTETICDLVVSQSGRLNAVVIWFDLHLAEGVSITSAPEGFTTGGRAISGSTHQKRACTVAVTATSSVAAPGLHRTSCSSSNSTKLCSEGQHQEAKGATCTAMVLHPKAAELQQQYTEQQQQQQPEAQNPSSYNSARRPYWGQSLRYLDHTAMVKEGDAVQTLVKREGSSLIPSFIQGAEPYPYEQQQQSPEQGPTNAATAPDHVDSSCCEPDAAGLGNRVTSTATAGRENAADGVEAAGGRRQPVVLTPAPRPPWLKPGAGIEDPNVWAVKKCKELLGQMLQRAPGGKFPPIYQDLQLMQSHAGSLGLDAEVLGAVTQELTMQEALAVAAQRQLAVSLASSAEAAGIKPPVVWR